MSTTHDENLRDARAEFLNMFNQRSDESIFNGLVLEIDAKEGFMTLATITRNATFQKFIGELRPEGIDSSKITHETIVYKAGIEIPRAVFDHSNALMGTEYGREILNIAEDSIDNRDNLVTVLLEANGNDITGTAFFGNAKTMPNSSATIDNLLAGTGSTATLIQDDFWSGVQLLADMVNAAGRPYHGGRIARNPMIIMYPTALEASMQNAFAAKTLPNGGDNVLFNRAELRVNPFLTDAGDWYIFVPNPRYPALAMGMGMPVESQDDTDPTSREVILRETYLFAARDEFIEAFGSPHAAVKIDN